MLIKVGNQTFDSTEIPIAVVLNANEKFQLYNATQDSLLRKRHDNMFFLKAPPDIPHKVAVAWAVEMIPEVKIEGILNLNPNRRRRA